MADFITNINKVAEKLSAIVEASELFDANIVARLEDLATMDISLITSDLAKGNYLGNRKIDIDLALNNQSTTDEVTYSSITVTLNNGVVIPIAFETTNEVGDTVVEEVASYTALYTKLVEGIEAYNTAEANPQLHVVNYEIDVVNQTLEDVPTLLRIRDTDGTACNIDRLTLAVFGGGSPVEYNPSYFWTKTTSALEVLANRVGDIIALGEDIDKIIALSDKEDEIQYLYDVRTQLQDLHDNLTEIIAVGTNIDAVVSVNANETNINSAVANEANINSAVANEANITNVATSIGNVNTVSSNIGNVNTVSSNINNLNDIVTNVVPNLAEILLADDNAIIATNKATEALNSATASANSATNAQNARDAILSLSVVASTLIAGSSATVNYNSGTGLMSFGIPQGAKGDKGDPFTVDAIGTLANRSTYNNQPRGFTYIATDETPPKIYFKMSDLNEDNWSIGSPFGQGETGNGIASIAWTSTTGTVQGEAGETDTYTITYTDASTDTFIVTNGAIPTKADLGLDNVDNTSDATKNSAVATLTNKTLETPVINNPTGLDKNDVGLNNVDNTSDATKNSAVATLTNKTLETPVINNPTGLTKSDVGLENVENTADADKKVSNLTQIELDKKVSITKSDVFIKPNTKALFQKVSPSSIKIPSGFIVKIDGAIVEKVADTTISLENHLDTGSKTVGTDYYVYAKIDGTFYISADDSIVTDRLIGGFHYGLTGEAEAISGTKTETDMVALRGINAYSFWDLKFRPICSTKGMVHVNGKWYDIYLLNSEHISNGTSKAGATIAGGATTYGRAYPKIPLKYGGDNSLTYGSLTWFEACEIGHSHGKELISYEEFQTIAFGVQEGNDSDAVDGGLANIEHYDYLTSKFGLEQATGTEWIWGKDLMNGQGSTDFAWKANTEGRGSIYSTSNSPTAVILGGNRGNASSAGSRSSSWDYYVWNSGWSVGCRFACDHLELA